MDDPSGTAGAVDIEVIALGLVVTMPRARWPGFLLPLAPFVLAVAGCIAGGATLVFAQDPASASPDAARKYTATDASGQVVVLLSNHVFTPAEIHVPAGRRIEILVKNLDPTPEEFDSSALKIEKVVGGRSEVILRLRPLEKGTYPFAGDYHAETTKGSVIAE